MSADTRLDDYLAPDEEILDYRTYELEDRDERQVLAVTDRRLMRRVDTTGTGGRKETSIRTTLFTGPQVTGVDVQAQDHREGENMRALVGFAVAFLGVVVGMAGVLFVSDDPILGGSVIVLGVVLFALGLVAGIFAYDSGDDGQLTLVVRTAAGESTYSYVLPVEDGDFVPIVSQAVGAAHSASRSPSSRSR